MAGKGEKKVGHCHDELGKDGLPLISESQKKEAVEKATRQFAVFPFITVAVGTGIAYSIHQFGSNALYSAKLSSVISNDLHYLGLSAFVMARLTGFVNMYPMLWKARIMSSKAGNLRSNMYIYRQQGSDDEHGKIVLEAEGDVGAYNRANRSMHHFAENVPGMLLCFPLAAYVFPFPSTVLMSIYALGRVMHQTGYTKGYGGHGLGFGLAMVAGAVIEGMNVLAALKGFGFM